MIDDRFKYNDNDFNFSDFNKYPHIVYATAFLVDGKLADYKIGNWQRHWGNRTFRGLKWEGEIIKDRNIKLTCEYNQVTVKNDNEHNIAFDILLDWLDETFEKYEPANLKIYHEDLYEIEKLLQKQLKVSKKTIKDI